MTGDPAYATFEAKWLDAYPEFSVASIFLNAEQRRAANAFGVLVHELDEIDGPSALELDALDLLWVEEDVMAFRDLISLDDLVAVHRAYSWNHLFISDALSARLVDLVELDLCTALGRREKLDGNRNQRKPDLSSPDRTRSHRHSPFTGRFNSLRRRVVPRRRLH